VEKVGWRILSAHLYMRPSQTIFTLTEISQFILEAVRLEMVSVCLVELILELNPIF
jgi:hypothetical protein